MEPDQSVIGEPGACALVHHILTIKRRGAIVDAMDDAHTTDVIQGTLDMLILKTLSLQPMHGFGLARRIEQVSRGVFKVNPGSLLTALQRLERGGYLDAEWRETENARRARIYTLTRTGRRRLEAETTDWNRRVTAVARLLKAEA
jgi:transcriptional regulator